MVETGESPGKTQNEVLTLIDGEKPEKTANRAEPSAADGVKSTTVVADEDVYDPAEGAKRGTEAATLKAKAELVGRVGEIQVRSRLFRCSAFLLDPHHHTPIEAPETAPKAPP